MPEEVKQERYERIMALSSQISTAKLAAKIGLTLEVLIDAVDPETGGDYSQIGLGLQVQI